jgi:hypothetical protein
MAPKTEEKLRAELHEERAALADAVDNLRTEVGAATDVSGKLKANLPLVAVGVFGLGFVKSGGIGATMRLLFRRGREGDEKAKAGPFSLVKR